MSYAIITDRKGNIQAEKEVQDPWTEIPQIPPRERWNLSDRGVYFFKNLKLILSPNRTKAYDLYVQIVEGVR